MVAKRNTRPFLKEELAAETSEFQTARTPGVAAQYYQGGGESMDSTHIMDSKDKASVLLNNSSEKTACNGNDKSDRATLNRGTLRLPAPIPPVSAILPVSAMERSTSSSSSSSSRSSLSSTSFSSTSNPTVPDPNSSALDDGKWHLPVFMTHSFCCPCSSFTLCDFLLPICLEEPTASFQLANIAAGAPTNFGEVVPGLYRSSYPKPDNYAYLQRLGLKTIVTLVDKNFSEGYQKFMTSNNIQHHVFGMKGTKKESIPLATMESILSLVLDSRNYPLLVHCNHGKHRTGCVVAVVRMASGWDISRIVQEYQMYAGLKVRDCDIHYIRAFDLSHISSLLSECEMSVRSLVEYSTTAGNAPGWALSNTFGFRVPNLIRAAIVSMTVLLIWMVSGSKMTQHRR